jgi:hypothetical protein
MHNATFMYKSTFNTDHNETIYTIDGDIEILNT